MAEKESLQEPVTRLAFGYCKILVFCVTYLSSLPLARNSFLKWGDCRFTNLDIPAGALNRTATSVTGQ
jgi:hypothetical protein